MLLPRYFINVHRAVHVCINVQHREWSIYGVPMNSYLLSSYKDYLLVILAVLAALAVAAVVVAMVVVLLQHIHWDLYMSNSIQYNHLCIDTCMSKILTHT